MEQIKEQKDQIKAQREALGKVESATAAPSDFKAFWKDGPRVETNDGNFKLKFGGRIHSDWYAASTDDDVEDAIGDIATRRSWSGRRPPRSRRPGARA